MSHFVHGRYAYLCEAEKTYRRPRAVDLESANPNENSIKIEKQHFE